jgi:hypothetical protein
MTKMPRCQFKPGKRCRRVSVGFSDAVLAGKKRRPYLCRKHFNLVAGR